MSFSLCEYIQRVERSLEKVAFKLVGRFFDDCRGDSVWGYWRGGFFFFRGAGALLGARTNGGFGLVRGVFVGNQGS